MADILYHVTTLSNALKILNDGIQPNKPQMWRRLYAGKFPKGYIYAFTDLLDSIRWAFKLDWELNEPNRLDPRLHPMKPIVIISFQCDYKDWIPDHHHEKTGYRGDWLKTMATVYPADILLLVNDARWRIELPKITAKEYFTRPVAGITI
jgi:hypothetical protein